MSYLFSVEFWELSSFVVTTLGFPFAIFLYIRQERKERNNEEEEAYQSLSDAYGSFLKLVLDNPDLKLRTSNGSVKLTDEQRERLIVIYEILISLMERAYIVAYRDNLEGAAKRRWASWEDYIRFWVKRSSFYDLLPELLHGEDPEFAAYIRRVADEERPR